MITKEDKYALKLIEGIGDVALRNIVSSNLSIDDFINSDENELNKYIKGRYKVSAMAEIQNNFHNYR
jgi:ERCC4-type nuclease|tara:strand:+ start:2799 stop:2999 length:201 start_codon:yes stop_codon:yes gene_type:complete